MNAKLYAVTGVTGRTGSVVAKTLLKTNHRVRVILRDVSKADEWTTLGAEIAIADFNDHISLSKAFSGTDGAYIVSPPQYGSDQLFSQAEAIARSITKAAQEANLQKLVALSSIGADKTDKTGWICMNRMLEKSLRNSGIAVTFLRAAYFMENWAPLVNAALENHQLPSFLFPLDRKIPMIATEDIGKIAAEVLCDNWKGIRILDLEGPAQYSPKDVAESIARKLGKSINTFAIPQENWAQAIAPAGFSSTAISGFIEMTQGLNSGHINFQDDLHITRLSGSIPLHKVIDLLLA